MTCAVCGAENETGAAFCFRCGSALKPTAPAATGPTVQLGREQSPSAVATPPLADDAPSARVYDVPPRVDVETPSPLAGGTSTPSYNMPPMSQSSTPTYTAPYGVGTMPQQSTTALIGMILSIVSFLGLSLLTAIPGIILGYNARKEIRASNGLVTGEGMAQAAIVLGWINIALTVLGFCAFCALFMLPFLGIAASEF